jgi:F1F0 ATPase subunit 2
MNIILIIAAFFGGAIAAYIYTMMLWKSVRSIGAAKKNILFIMGGFALRIGFCLAVFIAAGYGGHFDRLIACAVGFIIVRAIRVNMLKNKKTGAEKINGN